MEETELLKYFDALDDIIVNYGADTTIAEFLAQQILVNEPRLTENYSPEMALAIARRFAEVPNVPTLTDLRKKLRPSYRQFLTTLNAECDSIVRQAQKSLEYIVHSISVELIKNLRSTFVIDHDGEIDRIKDKLRWCVDAIKFVNDTKQVHQMHVQLQKLRCVDNVTSSAEGVVFERYGKLYKLTGNFAPVNQILGTFRYKR